MIEIETGEAVEPQIAFDAGGNAIAVWRQHDGAASQDILAKRYNATSGAWGAVQTVDTGTGNASEPQIAFDVGGNAIAVWKQSDGQHFNIVANRYSAGTSVWDATAPLIENDDAGNAQHPQIAVDANGNAIAVWEHLNASGIRSIKANRFEAASWGGLAQSIETDAGDVEFPQIAFDAGGNAIAVWGQLDNASGNWNIRANRYIAGTGWGAAVTIETGEGSAGSPEIAFDAGGNALVVWYQLDPTSFRNDIWANRYSSGAWGTAVKIPTGGGNAVGPRIAIDTGGNAIVVWEEYEGSLPSIWANRYSAGSGLWGAAELIETDDAADAFAVTPRIAIDPGGNAIAVWAQYNVTSYSIRANRYSAGSGWGTAETIETDAGDASRPQVAVDGSGNAIAIWYQFDDTRNNIWANRFE